MSFVTIYDPHKTVYLYLVDELTGSPVLSELAGSVYPIDIKSPRESLQKLVPMMYLGIAAMSMGAGVARMFGIPAPKMPASEAFKATGKISQANTVAQFDCLHESIEDAQKHNTTEATSARQESRVKALREFQEFLEHKDKSVQSPKTMLACSGS